MKVKVTKKFIDKHTGKLHKVGDELTVSTERFKEICKVDSKLVQEIQGTVKTEAVTTKVATKTTRKKKGEGE